MSRLEEKPLQHKLDSLFQKKLYLLAINLAKSRHCSAAELAEIYHQYGDHLYEKGDYDGAMGQFIKTIGFLQPSYVIRKVRRLPSSSIYFEVSDECLVFASSSSTLSGS